MTSTGDPNHIHVGKDGWLFLKTGTNNVIEQFDRPEDTADVIWRWRSLVAARERRLRAMGILYRHAVAPEKLAVYDNHLDGLSVTLTASPGYRLLHLDPPLGGPLRGGLRGRVDRWRRRRLWRRTCIDLLGPMRAARDAADLYCRTDTHWSFHGGRLAHAVICDACGVRARPDLGDRPFEMIDHDGDLGSAFRPPRRAPSPAYRIQRDAVRVFASPIVEARERAGLLHTLHVGAHVIYRNDRAGDPRRVVLFGDSFSHVMPYLLTIMLAETFRELHFVWSTSLDWAYIARVRPEIVLTEIAERFMPQVPDDAFDLDAYAAKRFGAELAAGA